MVNRLPTRALMAFALAAVAPGSLSAAPADAALFSDKVFPLLESRCISCHGPEKQKAGLRMDSREALLKGGESGPALKPGKPDDSLMLQAVLHVKPDLEMPPKEKLTPKDVAVLREWIAAGALWPKTPTLTTSKPEPNAPAGAGIGPAATDPRNPIVRIWGGQRLDLWSLKPIHRPELPSIQNRRWVRNGIDYFILDKLEQTGFRPSPEADRRTLARRVAFDLTGLPPSPADVAAFVRDSSPQAYERFVDKLLESPRYGEHTARQWLDVVRYSDSNGFDWDEFRPKAWQYRDYVVRSLNADKSFDQFVTEQLAGDELLHGAPKNSAEQDCLVATGYLRLGPQDNSAALFNEQARSRAELMADLVETTSSAFLGMTMACCRCHDHKYDPLSQADHYRMRAFFEAVKYGEDLPLDLAPAQKEIEAANKAIQKKIEPIEKDRETLRSGLKTKWIEEHRAKLSKEELALLATDKAKASPEVKSKIEAIEKKLEPDDKTLLASATEAQKKQDTDLGKQIETLKKQKKDFRKGLLMTDAPGTPPVTKILYQGDYRAEKDPVTPGFPSVLDPNPAPIAKPVNPATTGRRLTLARWITSGANPWTARVMVNRIWQSHFGRGLVVTPNDFGLAGARPSHPGLLDWLASDFIQNGWSLKKLHRTIVLSATYRQASSTMLGLDPVAASSGHATLNHAAARLDAENSLYWRQNVRRLSAEQLRDSVLATSGRLTLRMGGPPVWPSLPDDILQANPAFLDDNAEKTKGWYPSPEAERDVRSLYLIQKKTVKVPFLETFDLPENSVSCPRRNESTVAPQALTLMNSPDVSQAAKSFAARVRAEAGPKLDAQIQNAFDLALQRAPTPAELRYCLDLAQRRSLAELCRALLNVNEFAYLD